MKLKKAPKLISPLILSFILSLLSSNAISTTGTERSPRVSCGEQSTFPIGDEVFPISAVTLCDSHGDNVAAMCGCIEETFGTAIKDSAEYKAFDGELLDFDADSTAMIEFSQNIVSMEMATLANFIASTMDSTEAPFSPNGACGQRFQAYEAQVNAAGETNRSFGPISQYFYEQRDFNYLQERGFSQDVLNQGLSSFWLVVEGDEGRKVLDNREDVSNRFLGYIHNTMDAGDEGHSLRERAQAAFSGSSDLPYHNISKEDAIVTLCEGLIERFEEMRHENKTYKTPGDFIDRENLLTDRELTLLDIPAYRGLQASFNESNPTDSPMRDLYFNQRLCQYLPEERRQDGPLGRPEEEEFRSASDTELRDNIIKGNDALERFSEEIEAAELRRDQYLEEQREVEQSLGQILPSFGLTFEQFKDAYEAAGDDVNVVQVLEGLINGDNIGEADRARLEQVFTLAQAYHRLEDEFDKVGEEVSYIHAAHFRVQEKINKSFQELAHRKGGVHGAAEFIGMEEAISRTGQFYARLYEDRREDYIGPPPGHHEFLHVHPAGPASGRSDLATRVLESEVVERNTEKVVAEIAGVMKEDGSLSDTGDSALSAILNGTYSSERTGSHRSGRRKRLSGILQQTISGEGSFVNPSRGGGSVNSTTGPVNAQVLKEGDVRPNMATAGFEAGGPSNLFATNNGGGNGSGATGPAGSQLLAQFPSNTSPSVNDTRTTRAEAAVSSSIRSLEERLAELDRRNGRDTEGDDSGDEETRDDPEADLLRQELSRLRGELDTLREKSRKLSERRAEVAPTPTIGAGITPANNGPGVERRALSRGGSSVVSRAPAAATVAESATPDVSPTVAAPTVSDGGSFGPIPSGNIELPYSSRTTRREGDREETLGSFSGLNLTLINGSVGFAEVNARDLNVTPVEIPVDFLALSERAKADFIESFFSERSGESAVIRQTDGRVVLIERNSAFRPATTDTELNELDEEGVLRNQADTVHRVRSMNLALDKIFQ